MELNRLPVNEKVVTINRRVENAVNRALRTRDKWLAKLHLGGRKATYDDIHYEFVVTNQGNVDLTYATATLGHGRAAIHWLRGVGMCEHCTRRGFLGTGAASGLLLAGASWARAGNAGWPNSSGTCTYSSKLRQLCP